MSSIIRFNPLAGLVLVMGRADGVEGLFAFDTGAMQTSLNKKYFSGFEGKSAEVAVFDKSMSDTAAAETVLGEFAVGDIAAHGLPALLIDMSYVEDALRAVDPDVRFYGSVGLDFFGMTPILLDYGRCEMTVNPTVSTEGAEKIPMQIGAFPVITVELADGAHKFVLDTGANTCLLSADLSEKTDASPLKGAPGVYVLPKIKVGTRSFCDINAAFTDISQIRAKADVDGVIGGQILSQQPSLLDLSAGALYLF